MLRRGDAGVKRIVILFDDFEVHHATTPGFRGVAARPGRQGLEHSKGMTPTALNGVPRAEEVQGSGVQTGPPGRTSLFFAVKRRCRSEHCRCRARHRRCQRKHCCFSACNNVVGPNIVVVGPNNGIIRPDIVVFRRATTLFDETSLLFCPTLTLQGRTSLFFGQGCLLRVQRWALKP